MKKYEKENISYLLMHQSFVKAKRNEINLLVKDHKYSAQICVEIKGKNR